MCAMVHGRPYTSLRESMPQTVPSAGSSPPCDYSHFAADSFDLSLLPSPDCEVPYSPTSLHQLMALFCDPNSPPPMFHIYDDTGMFHDCDKMENDRQHSGAPESSPPYQVPTSSHPPSFSSPMIKEEPFSPYNMLGNTPASCYMNTPYAPSSVSPNPLSPSGSTSSCSTYSTKAPSPHHNQRSSPSPMQSIKQEQSIDIQEILKESKMLQESMSSCDRSGGSSSSSSSKQPVVAPPMRGGEPSCTVKTEPCGTSPCGRSAPDHQLLREVLRDTSFQRKYNLKPFDLGGLGGFVPASSTSSALSEVKMEEGSAAAPLMEELGREKIEPVLSLAIAQLRRDVSDTCSVLGIASDPAQWTVDDVKAWLLWTLRQYNLPMIPMEYFNMDGVALAALSEEEFQHRAPQCGSTLHAQLEIWKAACLELDSHLDVGDTVQWSNKSTSSSGEPSEDEDEETEPSQPTSGGGKTPSARGGSHIHLWQFLKELLAAPQVHGSCIRWLERSKGVFKIEDSVRVARLWGKRKNRPAMNYDKLSRSIRQYYKKGIMKKTERSQRLVYQFCHPYCL